MNFFKTVTSKWFKFFVLESGVGIRFKIWGKNIRDGFGIYFVCFGFTKGQKFSELAGLQRIEYESGQFFTE